MKVSFNAPVVLTFTIIATIVMVITAVGWPRFNMLFFAVGHEFVYTSVLSWFRLFSHIIGHADFGHLFGNFTMILLVGPMLEEKYSSSEFMLMIAITAVTTGVLQLVLFPGTLLLGASGVVFMMIILASMSNMHDGEIPATFILVTVIFLGAEIASAFKADNISQFTHIAGGICGAGLGFLADRKRVT